MRRRTFLKHTAAVGAAGLLPTNALAQALAEQHADGPANPSDPRPNFLFIITDDQRWDELGCVQKEQGEKGRFPWFRTPNMDRLAAEGIRFRNAFAVNSLCSPSRSCYLTGQYSHVNGVINNHTPMPLDALCSATLLSKAGYSTACVGKFHHGTQKERPGFQYIASYLDQGHYHDCPFNVNGTMTPTTGWIDDVATDYAIDFLKKHVVGEERDKPFFMYLGFKSPHDPRTPPPRCANMFADDAWSRPAPNLDTYPSYRPKPEKLKHTPPGLVHMDKPMHDKFRCIFAADEEVGRMLATLDELGLTENTVVIFVGDHGYYEGEHTLGDKRTAYEEAMRTPLIVRWPKLRANGVKLDQMALNIDLAPTMLDLAGVPIPKEMQGKSWRPLLEGDKDAEWRKAFFYEYFYENPYSFAPTTLAVRTEAAKLIKYPRHDEWTELFDLATDPYETRNLWSRESHLELRQQIAVNFQMPENVDKPKPGAGEKPWPFWN